MYFQFIYGVVLVFVTKSSGQMQNKCDLTAQPQCSTDCSSILLCSAGMENPIGSVRCPINTPFCEKGVCTEIPGSCSLSIDPSSFLCTSAGVFPDPSNCVRYHYCSDTGSTSVPHECPFGNIFNSKTKVCQRGVPRSSRKICQKITCKESGYVSFTANPSFYALCSSNIGVPSIIMYKCADEINQVFNENTRNCEYNCKSSGYFANPLDCSTYYICNGHKDYLPRRVTCPDKYYFNGTACINSSAHCPPGSISDTDTDTDTDPAADVTGNEVDNMISLVHLTQLLTSPLLGPLVTVGNKEGPSTQKCGCCSENYYFDGTTCMNILTYCTPGSIRSILDILPDVTGNKVMTNVALVDVSNLITGPLLGPLVSVGNKQTCACCPENYYFNGTVCINNSAYCSPGSIPDRDMDMDTPLADVSGNNVSTGVHLIFIHDLIKGPLVGALVDVSPGSVQIG